MGVHKRVAINRGSCLYFRMKVIGLTGGIGTGKSAVAAVFEEIGWPVLKSDNIAKRLLNTDPEVQEAVIQLLGKQSITDSGADNAYIASQVFGTLPEHKRKLSALNAIIHPRVLDAHLSELQELEASQCAIAVIESALLFEVGLDEVLDYVIVVDAPETLQIQRVMERSGLTREQVMARIAEQMPMTEKRNLADFVIDNSGSLTDLETAAKKLASIIEVLPERELEA